ncbi:zf-HC2 domain-containing protein [Latilactobacillus fuchuensis]|nr:zf-HC2 domain-containing protein [Latilactobacillus fuchuensis]SPC38360.1 conserved hypothetical protein [Latilactobacillus fuchuensis]
MNHNLFKDLVPNYLEHLTSQETNEQMSQHMTECEDCRQFLNSMQKDLTVTANSESKQETVDIDAFKKVKTQQRRKIRTIILSLLTLFIVLIAGYYFLFVHMWLANSNDVQPTITQQGNDITLTFETKNKHRYLMLINSSRPTKGYQYSLNMYEKWNDFSKANTILKKGTSVDYTFLDRNTLLLPKGKEYNGQKYHLTDKDVIRIKYRDKTQKIKLTDLYDSASKKK